MNGKKIIGLSTAQTCYTYGANEGVIICFIVYIVFITYSSRFSVFSISRLWFRQLDYLQIPFVTLFAPASETTICFGFQRFATELNSKI